MITAIIADDEPLLRAELRDCLTELWPECAIVAEASDGFQALNLIEEHRPSIAFLDIKMPRMTGLETAENVTTDTLLVFVTAFDDKAIEAFDKGAIDYLMKPIRLVRVKKTIERLKQQLELRDKDANGSIEKGKAKTIAGELNQRQADYIKFVQASVGRQVKFFMVDDILYLQSDTKYTRLVTEQAEAFIRSTITELADGLDPQQFWRVHRSTVVNIKAIDTVTREDGEKMTIKLRGRNEKLDVSRPHQSQFKGM